ncbi:hypothetical protein FQR65_LT10371 [Abscondita terminalis]|nr:hypothetical protein FQR65_LT10371 [Abscondita terminalis]
MSWLSFNESLNSIKGQLSNFASGVLAEGIINTADDQQLDKNDNVGDDEINLSSTVRQNVTYDDNNWMWESPIETSSPRNGVSYGVQAKIDLLENEKKELLASLEQLDSDHQKSMDKLLSIKENLQSNYNELTNDYEKLKKEYGDVLSENLQKNKEIEALRNTKGSDSEIIQPDDEMRQKLEEQIEKNTKLLEAKEDLERNKNTKLLETKEDLERNALTLQEKLRYLENVVKVAQDDRDSAIAEKDALQRSLSEANTHYKELAERHHQASSKVEQLNFDKAQLIVDKEMLQSANTKLQTHFESEIISENNLLKQQNISLLKEFEVKLKNLEEAYQKSLAEKQQLHEKYLSIITESMKKNMDLDSSIQIASEEQPEILEFANKVETLLKLLLDFKSKTENLEAKLCETTQEKSKIVAEKNFEIEKLLQNSEILSQEVINKTQAIKDYEDECAELIKNNELLIIELENFKKSGLQTISESNEDNLLMMESELDNANQKIQDMEIMISDLENSKQESSDEVQTELEYIKRQLNMTGQELSKSKAENDELLTRLGQLEEEMSVSKQAVDKIKTDYENIEYKYTEVNVGVEAVREENEELKRKIAVLDAKSKKFEEANQILEGKKNLLQIIVDEQKEQLAVYDEKLCEKDQQIRSYVERLQNSKMTETGLKLQVDTMSKELQSVLEAKNTIETNYNSLQKRLENENQKVVQDEFDKLTIDHSQIVQLNNELQLRNSALEAQLGELSQTRNELIALVTSKHEENVKYHAEIQRLTALRNETISPEELVKKNEDLEKLTDQNNFLREKCEVLAQNLLEEQSKVQKIISEQNTISDKEQTLMKELERLRGHLVEVEETYTQELVQAEQRNKEMLAKVNEIEQREKNSSSIYTSVSIRANQQVETLQTQLQLVSNQRDELRGKVSVLEDENNKHMAALTNLQFVLEQFQKDKQKDVNLETERIRRQIAHEKNVQDDLRKEINSLRMQLEESKQGLQAAARLTDQLDKCKRQIVNLKDEVSKLEDRLHTSESSRKELSTQNDTKVDKNLIKNLIIGYISSHANDQKQILKIIATVLDFSKTESDKVYLNKTQNSGWMSSILHPQGSNNAPGMSQESLSAAFVRFLENESRPKVLPNLLASKPQRKISEDVSSTSSTPPPLVLSEIVLPTFVDFAKNRNSSSILKDVLKDNT